jgi:uncharacterized membrane protein
MSGNTIQWMDAIFRWAHVLAGVMWIGHLWFFNFVNGQVAKTYDAESKQKVAPELMPRALYWFRWGALYTWVTGLLLLGVVYYMGAVLLKDGAGIGKGAAAGIGIGSLVVGWIIYDLLWKALAAKQEVGVIISLVLVAAAGFALSQWFGVRGTAIHVAAIMGTCMFLNVWMRIWPAQRRIIKAIKEGGTPPASDGPLAGLRSKHNTYMSVPLIFLMLNFHTNITFGFDPPWLFITLWVVVGFALTKLFYVKAASEAPKFY